MNDYNTHVHLGGGQRPQSPWALGVKDHKRHGDPPPERNQEK